MTTNNEAFEAIYPVPDGIWFHSDGDYINKDDTPNEYNNMWHTWQAATANSASEVAELKEKLLNAQLNENVMFVENDALKFHINELREALEFCRFSGEPSVYKIADKALSTIPSESLQAHDDEVLSKLRVINWTESMSVAWHKAIPDLHKAFDDLIEAMKGK